MIKAVGFDLWETLITNPPELSLRQEELRLGRIEGTLLQFGVPAIPRARLELAYREGWNRCYELYWSADLDIPCRQQVIHLAELLGFESGDLSGNQLDELEAAYVGAVLDSPPLMVEGARDTLRELRGKGLRLGLISNTGRTPGRALRDVLEHHRLGEYFDAMVFSDEHGECKPRPSIFERLRAELNVNAGEIVFVGDHPWIDVSGAKRCGMRAVHFVPAVRGNAVAPEVAAEPVPPDAVITDLRELPAIVERMRACPPR